ncbi:DUF5071 domain-containing protein [Haploplasma modicum]|uniref:DUF5071 domain-containing protein n=1 Tax=Haploplasma modicum TaxID=2150 RepID=UPI00138B0431|nr:DUF5071 domain-containing protein [Haploplasma modicum]
MKKEEVLKYLPAHKLDNFYIDDMMELSDDDFTYLIDGLLLWMKNMNFLVSKEIALVLAKRPVLMRDIFIKLLDDERVDAIFKYNIIAYVISQYQENELKNYEKSFNRLADKPTKEEKYAEVDILVKKLINK